MDLFISMKYFTIFLETVIIKKFILKKLMKIHKFLKLKIKLYNKLILKKLR
jgi:Na+-translocating ferredoxin:NAD+ oxidoreductase RnfA subunit